MSDIKTQNNSFNASFLPIVTVLTWYSVLNRLNLLQQKQSCKDKLKNDIMPQNITEARFGHAFHDDRRGTMWNLSYSPGMRQPAQGIYS